MNQYDYLKARIEKGRGIKIDRTPVYSQSSFACGESARHYTGGTYMVDAEGKRIKGGKISNNTYAYHDHVREHAVDTIVVRYHETDILRVYPSGHVVALDDACSFTTRVRYNEHMASGWSTGNADDQTWLYGPICTGSESFRDACQAIFNPENSSAFIPFYYTPFLFPFAAGAVTGWDTAGLAELMVGIRVGCPVASDALAKIFRLKAEEDPVREEAWLAMADTTLAWKGRSFGDQKRKYKALYATLAEPTGDGLWLCDPATGVLERALTRKDDLFGKIDHGGFTGRPYRLTLDGKVWDLVDGFKYSAKHRKEGS